MLDLQLKGIIGEMLDTHKAMSFDIGGAPTGLTTRPLGLIAFMMPVTVYFSGKWDTETEEKK